MYRLRRRLRVPPVNGNVVIDVLPCMTLLGFGAGIAFNPVLLAAMSGVKPMGRKRGILHCLRCAERRKRIVNAYTLALFAHVSGAMGYFIAMGVWLFGLAAIRRATRVEQVRTLADLVGGLGPLFGISVFVILASGLFMAFTTWGFQTGWIDVALVSLVLIAPIGGVLIEPRRRLIVRLAQEAPDGALPQKLAQHTHDPLLATTVQTVTALLLGIVFLMTNKPSLLVALLVMAIALTLGLTWGVLAGRRAQDVPAQARRTEEVIE
jgi:NAD/NADP transhydrogenase beta subunit